MITSDDSGMVVTDKSPMYAGLITVTAIVALILIRITLERK